MVPSHIGLPFVAAVSEIYVPPQLRQTYNRELASEEAAASVVTAGHWDRLAWDEFEWSESEERKWVTEELARVLGLGLAPKRVVYTKIGRHTWVH